MIVQNTRSLFFGDPLNTFKFPVSFSEKSVSWMFRQRRFIKPSRFVDFFLWNGWKYYTKKLLYALITNFWIILVSEMGEKKIKRWGREKKQWPFLDFGFLEALKREVRSKKIYHSTGLIVRSHRFSFGTDFGVHKSTVLDP